MNLDILVQWGVKTLALLDKPERLPAEISISRLQTKLGWLRNYGEGLAKWSADLTVIEQTLEFTRTNGVFAGMSEIFDSPASPPSAPGGALACGLLEFVEEQSSAACSLNEQLPASTEVLESCFGKLKYLEHEQSKSGFTWA